MDIQVGMALPEWRLAHVPVEPMKTVAALLQDPNPIHWDVQRVRELGLGSAPVNQGPTNMAYVVNMLLAWLGDAGRIRSLAVRFNANVHGGDSVVASGTVVGVEAGSPLIARCDVALHRAEQRVLSGVASVEVHGRLRAPDAVSDVEQRGERAEELPA